MEKAIERQRVLLEHLNPNPSNSVSTSHHSTDLSASFCSAGQTGGSENDVVIVAAYRTAICKAKRGGFKDTLPDDLLAAVLKAVIEKTNVEPSEVGDIVVGTVLGPGSERAIECRMAAFYAGFPETVPLRTVNRQCSSGLQAVADVAAYIKAGFYDIGIGAGLECMTQDNISGVRKTNPKVETFAQARDCLLPMGITSENVAERYGVTRLEQDQAAVESHRRAAAATASGKFKDEIIPVSTKIVDPKTGEEKKIIVSVDDGIRPNANLVDLAKLKPAFKKDGSTTAGNASQVSDGAAAVLLMKRSVAVQKGLPILGIFRSFVVVGVDPVVMGTGPAFAIPAAVKSAGLELGNIDLFEINEAFASQFLYSCKKLGLDSSKVNVNGGVIAVGHPLGATGARCVATLLNEMKRCGKDCHFGVISMCIGFAAMRGIGTMGAANSTSKEANFSSSAIWLKNAPNYVSALGAEIGNNSIPQNNLEPEGFAETRGNKFIPGFPLGTTWEDTAMISDNITGLKRYKDDDDDVKPFSAGLNPAETKNETGGQPPTAPLAHQMSMPNTTAELEAIEKFLQFSDSVPCKIRDKRGCATHPRSIAERCSDFFI